MACTNTIMPFGFNALTIVSEDGHCTADLCGRQLQVTPTLTTSELRCNDTVTDSQSKLDNMSWSSEAGGISIEAYNIMMGMESRTYVMEDGSTATSVLAKENQRMPYFSVYGKSVGRDGDDVHVRLFRAQIQSIDGTFQQDEYFITSLSGIAIADDNGNIFELAHHQEEQDIWANPWPESMRPVAWYKPDTLCSCNGLSSGDPVSEWVDSISEDSQFSLVQTATAAQPVLVENWCNGHCALQFDGVDDMMQVLTDFPALPAGTSYGFIMSGAFQTLAGFPSGIAANDSGTPFISVNAANQFVADAGTQLTTSETADLCPFTIGMAVNGDTTSTVIINNTELECTDVGAELPNMLQIGTGADGTFSDIYVAEIMILPLTCVEDLKEMVMRQQEKYCCCENQCTCAVPCTNC